MAAAVSGGKKDIPKISLGSVEDKLVEKLRNLRFRGKEVEVKQQAAESDVPYFNLQGFPINPESIALITEDEARSLGLVCFWFSIDDMRLGSINPKSVAVQKKIAELAAEHHTSPRLYLISFESLRIAFEVYNRVPKIRATNPGVEITAEDISRHTTVISTLKDLGPQLANVSTTEVVTTAIAGALQTRASDIHIEAGEHDVALRYRIDGVLYPVATVERPVYEKLVSRLKLLAGLKINVTDKPQDGRFTIQRSEGKVDVRVSTLPTAHGESIVMRLLLWAEKGVSFEELGLTGYAYDALVKELSEPNGMILATGPTGSGKTTTLYAILNRLKKNANKIITLEDPIEYELPGVNQSQVDEERGYTFAAGLRSILRQDPNIIMVGEIRDRETADIAANAALTGHLVLSTLHTNNAAGAIPRLVNIGLRRFLIPPALNIVIGQRLVRRLCESCKKAVALDAPTKKRLDTVVAGLPESEKKKLPKELTFFIGVGCDACQGLGYKGQIGVFEALVMDHEIEELVLSSEDISELQVATLARKKGMLTMVEDGILKAVAGITSVEEIFRVTRDD
ncbi:MAG: GspE/PulE family protein [Patescibacteria group bacterium]|jgi:type IV pilus assembly protein PilB